MTTKLSIDDGPNANADALLVQFKTLCGQYHSNDEKLDAYERDVSRYMNNANVLRESKEAFAAAVLRYTRAYSFTERTTRFKLNVQNICYTLLFDETNEFDDNVNSITYFMKNYVDDGMVPRVLNYLESVYANLSHKQESNLLDALPVHHALRARVLADIRSRYVRQTYTRVKPSQYYDDTQNVHNTGINDSAHKTSDKFTEDKTHLYDEIVRSLRKREPLTLDQEKALTRIKTDSSGLNLANVFCNVWCLIDGSEHRDELIKRLLQELTEMSGYCSSGHYARLLNVTSGFFDDEYSIKVAFNDEMSASFMARWRRELNALPEETRERFANEMISVTPSYEYGMFKTEATSRIASELRSEYEVLFDDKFTAKTFEKFISQTKLKI